MDELTVPFGTQENELTSEGIVALFNASDDTIDMVQRLLTKSDSGQTLIWCHFADLKKGVVDFDRYIRKHSPEVVIFDLSPPYDENWTYFKKMRDNGIMKGRGIVLTTTNKDRLDEVLGSDSHALEVVGRPEDLALIDGAIRSETRKAGAARQAAR
jgi:DNA-binding response OmpR family regulator